MRRVLVAVMLAALVAATHATVDDCIGDALSQTAWDVAAYSSDEVRSAREAATDALAQMVERARAAGALREDASHEDLRLVFCALRELAGIGASTPSRAKSSSATARARVRFSAAVSEDQDGDTGMDIPLF